MGYACQVKRSGIQGQTRQQSPAGERQRHFQSSQWLMDFPQQSHHDFSTVERQDRKQIKNGEIHIQENGKLEQLDKTQAHQSAASRDDSHDAGKMFRLAEKQRDSSADLHRHLPDLFQRKNNGGIDGATELYDIHQRQTQERSQNVCCRTSQGKQDAILQRYFVESLLIFHRGQHVAATRDQGQPIFGFTHFETPYLWAQADRETRYRDTQPFCRQKVSQFMQND